MYDWQRIDESWTGFDASVDQQIELESADRSGGSWHGPVSGCPDGKFSTQYYLDFLIPELLEYDNQLNALDRSVTVQYRYRHKGTQEWTTASKTWTAASRDQIAETVEFNPPIPICAEVQWRRITPKSDDPQVKDQVNLVRLRCNRGALTSTKGTRGTLAVRGVPDQTQKKLKLMVTRLLNTVQEYIEHRDTGLPLPEPAKQLTPGPALVYMALDAGFPIDAIDLENIKEFDDQCQASGQTYNDEISGQSTVSALQKVMLKVGYGKPIIRAGKLAVHREGINSSLGHLYTPHNTTSLIRRDEKFYDGTEPDGLLVEYFPPDAAKPTTVMCTDPDYTPVNPKKISLRGANDRVQAWRFGMREYERLKQNPVQVSLDTEMDGLNSEHGSIAYVADGLEKGQQGRVMAYSDNVLTVDQTLEFTQPLMLIVVSDQGGKTGKVLLASKVADKKVLISERLHFTPVFDGSMELPRFSFGAAETLGMKTVVDYVRPSGTSKAKVTAFEYIESIYKHDNEFPPEDA